MALVISILLLLLVSALALSGLDHSGGEAQLSGHARRSIANLHAAEAGLERARAQLLESPPRLDAYSGSLTNATYRSGSRSDGSPQPLPDPEVGPPPAGYSINIGGGYLNQFLRATSTADGIGGGAAEVDAKYSKLEADAGSYR